MASPKKTGKKSVDVKKPNRSGKQIAVYVDDDIHESIGQYIADYNEKNPHPATLRSTVEASLKAFLKAAGHYPPKEGRAGKGES